MNESTFDMTEVNPSGRRAAAEPSEPLYEPPGYLPSSYQLIDEPVTLTPKFDDSSLGTAPSAGSASTPSSGGPSATAQFSPTVVTTGTAAAPEVTKYLQNLPAPTTEPSPSTPQAAQSRPATLPTASAADLSKLPAPAPGSSAMPGGAQAPASVAPTSVAPPVSSPATPVASAPPPTVPSAVTNPSAAPVPTTAPAPVQRPAEQAMPAQQMPAQRAPAATPPSQFPAASVHTSAPRPPAPAAPTPARTQAAPAASTPAPSAAATSGDPDPIDDLLRNIPGPVSVAPAAPASSTPASSPIAREERPMPDAPSAAAKAPVPTSTDIFAAPRDASLSPDADLEEALQTVLRTSGSDLHVSAGAPPMVRVDGALRPIKDAPVWSVEKVASALYSIVTPKQREAFEEKLEFDFAYTLSENARFRVNFYQQRGMLGAAFRLIPTEIKPLSALGVPDSIASFAKLPRGLVLVTGPTGSGKSTTLASLIDLANRTRTDHIMTVEDPIEFLHTNHKSLVNQREVGHDTESFASALKHVLRQDPDIILVGELRDLETISVALTAAETGHLVFATLHTQSAPQTIDRIIDVYPPHQQGQVRAQLASTLQGVVCQTLIKRANGKGRVVATEVLMATHAVANLIREGKTYQVNSAMQAGGDLGMHTLDQHLADLVNSGQITFESAVDKAQDFEVLKRLVTRVDTTGVLGSDMAGNGMNFSDAYSGGQY